MASHVLEINGRNAALDAVTALVNGGRLDLTTSADAVLASFTGLPSPAFSAASGGSASIDNSPTLTATASGTGTAAKGKWYTSGGALVATDDVTLLAGSGTLKMDNTNVVSGQVVNVAVAGVTWTQPAGT